jgi:signal peptide peptidase SppA
MFTPKTYLKQQVKSRRRQFKNMLFVTLSVSMVTAGAVSLTTYAAPTRTQATPVSVVEKDNYEVVVRPQEAPNTSDRFDESLIEDSEETSDDSWEEDEYYEEYDYIGDNNCNVLGITLTGDIGTDYGMTYSNDIRDVLEEYGSDERLEAILVEVDSGGGSPVAGDEIATLLAEQTIPVVAHVREIGASAAYLAILPADYIFAHRYGSVGSIGVIIPLYDYSKFNEKEGIEYNPIVTSPFKDIGTSERPMTVEERGILQAEVDFIYEGFVNDVVKYRNLSYDRVKALANGRTYLAHVAKELGLIDAVGGRPEVLEYLTDTIGAEPVICRVTYVE